MEQKHKTIIAVLVSLIGVGCLLEGLFSYFQTKSYISNSIHVHAEVNGVITRGPLSYPVLTFVDFQTNRYTIDNVPNTYFVNLKTGDSVKLYFDPSSPQIPPILDTFSSKWLSPLIFLLVGALFSFLGYNLYLWSRAGLKRSVQKVANQGVPDSIMQKAVDSFEVSHTPIAKAADQNISKPDMPVRDESTFHSNGNVVTGTNNLFGILQKFIDDRAISDVIVSHHSSITVVKDGKTCQTDIAFGSEVEYITLVEQLLMKAGVSYSTAKPIVDGVLGSDVRLHAVHPVLCDRGPYLAIRISRFKTIGYEDLHTYELAPLAIFNYLKEVVKSGQTVLVAGSVGTGKTTLVRALASSISRDESILVIEDTPEVKINHPNVRYIHTREANSAGIGNISLSECIKAGMRMAMDRVILGEIRDSAAAEAFIDVCVSGHPGLSTIHARSAFDALNRLELFLGRQQPGVTRDVLREEAVSALQVIVYLKICPITRKRRIFEIRETALNPDGSMSINELFRYKLFETNPGWQLMRDNSLFEEAFLSSGIDSPLKGIGTAFGLES